MNPKNDIFLYDAADIIAEAGSNTLVLTPNQRISHHIQKSFSKTAAKNESWAPLKCLPWSSWMVQIWQDASDALVKNAGGVLLNKEQEIQVWERILVNSVENPLFKASQASKLAMNGFALCSQWHVDYKKNAFDDSLEYVSFRQWCLSFENELRERNWIVPCLLEKLVVEWTREDFFQLPEKIILANFVEITPSQNLVLESLKESGVEIRHVSSNNKAEPFRLSFKSHQDELENAFRWAKKTIHSEENAVVGLIIPDLSSNRAKIERMLSETFEPQRNSPAEHRSVPPFNISAGQPLIKLPIIESAIKVLGLNLPSNNLADFTYVLLSPFLFEEYEFDRRVLLDIAIRSRKQAECNLRTLILLCSDNNASYFAKNLSDRLRTFDQIRLDSGFSRKHYPSYWGKAFLQQLQAINWPGSRDLDSIEYQSVKLFKTTLEQLATFDHINHKISLSQALSLLVINCQNTSFQAETIDSPIQVLGLLEAAGLSFTHLWILGLDDQSWPPAPSPSPFIPDFIQRELGMPHASAAREHKFAEYLMTQYQMSADRVIYSSPQFDGDKELGISSLLEKIPAMTVEAFECKFLLNEVTYYPEQVCLETINDDFGVELPIENVKGGTSILKKQSACPFKAYAELRLSTYPFEESSEGLDPMVRGNVVHLALESIWQRLKDQQQLLQFEQDPLRNLINDAIVKALDEYLESSVLIKNGRLYQNELQRISLLIEAWLDIEKLRSPFKVKDLEQWNEVDIQGLRLNVRADRIDELEDNSHLIIDYKTGGYVSQNQWLSDRPEEPQLPLYSTLHDVDANSIAFGQVNASQVGFTGLAGTTDIAPGVLSIHDVSKRFNVAEDWHQQLSQWKDVMEALVAEYKSGLAVVKPRKPEVCRLCQLQPFCRIHTQ
mgnify:FL=1